MKTKEERNKEYLKMIDKSIEQLENEEFIVKTVEELEEIELEIINKNEEML